MTEQEAYTWLKELVDTFGMVEDRQAFKEFVEVLKRKADALDTHRKAILDALRKFYESHEKWCDCDMCKAYEAIEALEVGDEQT